MSSHGKNWDTHVVLFIEPLVHTQSPKSLLCMTHARSAGTPTSPLKLQRRRRAHLKTMNICGQSFVMNETRSSALARDSGHLTSLLTFAGSALRCAHYTALSLEAQSCELQYLSSSSHLAKSVAFIKLSLLNIGASVMQQPPRSRPSVVTAWAVIAVFGRGSRILKARTGWDASGVAEVWLSSVSATRNNPPRHSRVWSYE